MNTSAFLIAGTKSGAGKTTITLGLMSAIQRRGYDVTPYKCGPDFIDPSLHKVVTRKHSANLDLRMCGGGYCLDLFSQGMSDGSVSVVEGVMGLFDGGDASSAALAKCLDIPVILIIDVRSAAESIAAVLSGFENFDQNIRIAGVIFNQCGSERHQILIKESVEKHCRTKILGFIPRSDDLIIPHRHLGLHMGLENDTPEKYSNIADIVEQYVNIESLISSAEIDFKERKNDITNQIHIKKVEGPAVNLAVAIDEAFCFYYRENLSLLENYNIKIIPFSPLRDKVLPKGIQGIYFGGGYPELFAKKLSQNNELMEEIKDFGESDGLIYGECGGLMLLSQGIYDRNNEFHKMSGIFPFATTMKERLVRLGYRKVVLKDRCYLGEAGDILHGHEFHYSEISGSTNNVKKSYTINERKEGYTYKNVTGSYVHLHFGNTLKVPQNIYENLVNG